MKIPKYSIALNISKKDQELLLSLSDQLYDFFSQKKSVENHLLVELKKHLSRIFSKTIDDANILFEKATIRIIHLIEEDYKIINLPWHLAYENQPLTYLCKGYSKLSYFNSRLNSPIRVLFILSYPIDIQEKLQFEEEYKRIYNSLGALINTGEVYIDVLESGLFNELELKLKEQHFDIIHYIGHSHFSEKAMMEIESDDSLVRDLLGYDKFGELLAQLDSKPTLVYLSSCDTALGNLLTQNKSATHHILDSGVPNVVSFSDKLDDNFAVDFAVTFYKKLSETSDIVFAFNETLWQYNQLDKKDVFTPQLFCSSPAIDEKITRERPLYLNSSDFEIEFNTNTDSDFVGRIDELRLLIDLILKNEAINIVGKDGVGRRALVREVIRKLSASKRDIKPIFIPELIDNLEVITLATKIGEIHETLLPENRKKESFKDETIGGVITAVREQCTPLVVFLIWRNEPFKESELPNTEIVGFAKHFSIPCVIISEKPYQKTAVDLKTIHLGPPDFIEFYRKCLQYDLVKKLDKKYKDSERISTELEIEDISLKGANVRGMIRLIYDLFEGNYKKLDQFFKYISSQYSMNDLTTIDVFRELYRSDFVKEMLRNDKSSRNEFKMLSELTDHEWYTLEILEKFDEQVATFGFHFFGDSDFEAILNILIQKNILETFTDEEKDLKFFIISPWFRDKIKPFLEDKRRINEKDFLEQAIKYFRHLNTFYESFRIGEKLFNLFLKIDDNENAFKYGFPVIEFLHDQQQTDKALKYCSELIKRFTENGMDQALAMLLPMQGALYKEMNQAELALPEQEKLYQLIQGKNQLLEAITLDNMGSLYFNLKNYEKALEFSQNGFDLLKALGNQKHLSICAMNLGGILWSLGRYEEAKEMMMFSIKKHEEGLDLKNIGTAFNNLAALYLDLGDLEEAQKYFEKSIVKLIESGRYKKAAITYISIAKLFIKTGNLNQSEFYLEKALKIAEKINEIDLLGSVYQELGYLKFEQREYKVAYDILQKSYSCFEQANDQKELHLTIDYIGDVLKSTGNFDGAEKRFLQSKQYYQQASDFLNLVSVLNRLALLYHESGKYVLALETIEEASAIQQEHNIKGLFFWNTINHKGMILAALGRTKEAIQTFELITESDVPVQKQNLSKSYQSLGHVLLSQKQDVENALFFFKKSLELKRTFNDISGMANSAGSIGACYSLMQDYGQAKAYFLESLDYLKQLNDLKRIADCQCGLIRCYLSLNENEAALSLAKECLAISRQLNDLKQLVISLQFVAEAYYALGNKAMSLETQMEAYSLISLPLDPRLCQHVGHRQAELFRELGMFKESEAISKYLRSMMEMIDILNNSDRSNIN